MTATMSSPQPRLRGQLRSWLAHAYRSEVYQRASVAAVSISWYTWLSSRVLDGLVPLSGPLFLWLFALVAIFYALTCGFNLLFILFPTASGTTSCGHVVRGFVAFAALVVGDTVGWALRGLLEHFIVGVVVWTHQQWMFYNLLGAIIWLGIALIIQWALGACRRDGEFHEMMSETEAEALGLAMAYMLQFFSPQSYNGWASLAGEPPPAPSNASIVAGAWTEGPPFGVLVQMTLLLFGFAMMMEWFSPWPREVQRPSGTARTVESNAPQQPVSRPEELWQRGLQLAAAFVYLADMQLILDKEFFTSVSESGGALIFLALFVFVSFCLAHLTKRSLERLDSNVVTRPFETLEECCAAICKRNGTVWDPAPDWNRLPESADGCGQCCVECCGCRLGKRWI